jgi:drug/metabolite transporter (DMT)-like permease
MFALSNVLARKAAKHSVAVKSVAIWFGVTLVCLAYAAWRPGFIPAPGVVSLGLAAPIALVGVILFALMLVVQYGLAHTPANQAIVIMVSELVFAAVSAHFLAGETVGLREWAGGALIVLGTLFSGRLDPHAPKA